jgi:hypothetical protein
MRQIMVYKCKGGSIQRTIMQAYTEFAIADDCVLVCQDITDFELIETKQSVKTEGIDDVGRLYAKFEESTQHD